MVDLFMDRILLKNTRDQEELDTEREIVSRLQNHILMLFFASAESQSCRRFAPTLSDFYKKLTDEFYVERSAQLVLLYISLDHSEEQQESFLKQLPTRSLFLAYEDPYRRELEAMFNVQELPTVLVLRPDGSVLVHNAVQEIISRGPDCFQNWQEAAELIDRNFMINEDVGQKSECRLHNPTRRGKYKVEGERRRRRRRKETCGGWGRGGDGGEEESRNEGGGGGGGVPF